jgi:hypothetical protein
MSSAVVALTAITLCACAVGESADPPAPNPTGNPAANPTLDPSANRLSTPAAADLPTRTRDFSLQGVNPCTLLTPQQLDGLRENGAPRPVAQDSQRDGPTCAFDVDAAPPTYTYYLETITTADLEDWIDGGHTKASMVTEPVEVPGFPALMDYAPSDGGIMDCETLVGVASGQTLRAQVAPDDNSFNQQQLCDMSTNLAKLAVQTLAAGAVR